MKIEVISGITRITADVGKKLTNGDTFGTEVWLPEGEPINSWWEVNENADTTDLLLDELEVEL